MPTAKRATKITQTRQYKTTKRRARRPRAIFKLDKGNVEQTITLVFPENSRYSNMETPSEANPSLTSFNIGNVRLSFYNDSGKGFVYDCDGIYVGRFEKHDLKNLFARIGLFLQPVRKKKG